MDTNCKAIMAIFAEKVKAVKILHLPSAIETTLLIEVIKAMIVYTEVTLKTTNPIVSKKMAEEITYFLERHNN